MPCPPLPEAIASSIQEPPATCAMTRNSSTSSKIWKHQRWLTCSKGHRQRYYYRGGALPDGVKEMHAAKRARSYIFIVQSPRCIESVWGWEDYTFWQSWMQDIEWEKQSHRVCHLGRKSILFGVLQESKEQMWPKKTKKGCGIDVMDTSVSESYKKWQKSTFFETSTTTHRKASVSVRHALVESIITLNLTAAKHSRRSC